ncbi:S-Ena type endospore appendage [Peribacillus alkalitolerans]|uniref:S-Ena type endospore appendage n=1 Tax=Peribacillus alkalitolerans TaxID=1550385 RepID=UPI0013D1DB93|nr:S-Ena type endospore appendage [Peribacillus alkalitolerans]
MCGSHKNHNNGGFCCPNPQIFVEENCGNLRGPLGTIVGGEPATFVTVWSGPTDSDYFQGTFEVFNCGPTGNITFNVGTTTGEVALNFTVTPGNTRKISVNSPSSFNVNVPAGTSGKFCITLYKRVVC